MLLSQHPCPPLPEDLPNRAKNKKLETNPLQSANTDNDPQSTTNRERICKILAEHYIVTISWISSILFFREYSIVSLKLFSIFAILTRGVAAYATSIFNDVGL